MSDSQLIAAVGALAIGACTYIATRPDPVYSEFAQCQRRCVSAFPLGAEGDKLLKCMKQCAPLATIQVNNKPTPEHDGKFIY
jgi:hypothetical protein